MRSIIIICLTLAAGCASPLARLHPLALDLRENHRAYRAATVPHERADAAEVVSWGLALDDALAALCRATEEE